MAIISLTTSTCRSLPPSHQTLCICATALGAVPTFPLCMQLSCFLSNACHSIRSRSQLSHTLDLGSLSKQAFRKRLQLSPCKALAPANSSAAYETLSLVEKKRVVDIPAGALAKFPEGDEELKPGGLKALESLLSGERGSVHQPDVPADASTDFPADASAEVPADTSAYIPVDAFTDVLADASTDVSADAFAEIPADSFCTPPRQQILSSSPDLLPPPESPAEGHLLHEAPEEDHLEHEFPAGRTLPGNPSLLSPANVAGAGAAQSAQGRAPGIAGKPSSGLLRSPTTGGVQTATHALGLPDPAVAVRNLIAQSKQGHLCTVMSRMHHRRAGFPFASLIDFATDPTGHPIFSLSPLAFHSRNLLADPRCTLVVQMPGWSGLADARVTFFGEVYPVAAGDQELANSIYCARHHQERSAHWGNSQFFRMVNIRDIYFVGGFGTVSWVDVPQYTSAEPDKIAANDSEQTLEILNSTMSGKLKESLTPLVKEGAPMVDVVQFIGVDGKGVDVRVHQGSQSYVRRLSYESGVPVETVQQAESALNDILNRAALPDDFVDQKI